MWSDAVPLTGAVIRTEQTLPRRRETVRFLLAEVRRVAAGEPVAVEYDTGEEYFTSALLLRLRERLAAEEAVLAGDGRAAGNEAFLRELRAMRSAAARADVSALLTAAGQARRELFPRQITYESAASLRREIRTLEAAGAGERILTAPAAGLFSPYTDGWENLSPDPSGAFEGDSLSAVLNTPVRPSPGAGKLITGSSWQLAAFVRPEDAARLSPGTELELLLPEGSYPARAAALQIRADGQATAVIVCSRGMTAVADKRVLSARAVLGRTEGLLLPAAAVRRDEEGDYVLRQAGRFVRRESVTVLARREGQALVRSDALREGSEVLLPAS